MKKSIFFLLALCIITGNPADAQKPGFLKKVTNSMTNELLGRPEKAPLEPEPSCACDQPQIAIDLGGKLKLDYKELTISILDDGRILAQHVGSNEYYIAKDGVIQGPYKSGDPRIKDFEVKDEENTSSDYILLVKNKQYISRSGNKYMISFGGKSYGPYGSINNFVVTKSKDKFAALVVENVLVTEDDGKKMDEAVKNAKSEQEKMDLAMQYSQEMLQRMQQGGGPPNMMPKLITNIPNANYDFLKVGGGIMDGNIKYDDILIITYDKIIDLQMKPVMTLGPDAIGAKDLFVNADNTKYAAYNYGSINFSDNTSMSDLFNPQLIKADGKVYISYMYYSPKKNAIMKCRILF
jgi:hypothetical protein